MAGYQEALDHLSCRAEFLRREMVRELAAGNDVSELHGTLDQVRRERLDLAMLQNRHVFDAACVDLDASQKRATSMPATVEAMHGFEEVTH